MNLGLYRLDFDEAGLARFERSFGARLKWLSFYRAWNHCRIEDDIAWLARVTTQPREILLTWEPWRLPSAAAHPEDQPAFALSTILAGRHDTYIRDFAVALRDLHRTVHLRPLHEMNGCWYPWCGTVNGNRPDEVVRAWRHLREIFRAAGARDVRWVWSPYAHSYPPIEPNRIAGYFPGDDEVDRVAIDAYNWGATRAGKRWELPTDLLGEPCREVARLSARPLMIAEVGCAEAGGDKAAWIDALAAALRADLARVDTLIWFDVDKECDWRIESTARAAAAFHRLAAGLSVRVTPTPPSPRSS